MSGRSVRSMTVSAPACYEAQVRTFLPAPVLWCPAMLPCHAARGFTCVRTAVLGGLHVAAEAMHSFLRQDHAQRCSYAGCAPENNMNPACNC